MKTKSKLAFALCLTALSALTSCGGSTGSGGTNTITIGIIGDSVETGIINKLKEGFLAKEENKGIRITPVKITNGYDTWVLQKMGTKTVPDMIQVYDFNCRYWTNKGLFQPISDLMERDAVNPDDFSSSVIGMAQSGENDDYYWLPRDYNKMAVCINTDMFVAAGIALPKDDWTMTDFYRICTELKAKESAIKAVTKQTTFYPVEMQLNAAEVYYPYMRSYGGDLFAKEGENVKVYNDLSKVKQGANALLKYADEDLALPPDTSAVAFINKQAAMIFTSRPNVPSYAKRLNNKIDFVSMPTIDDRPSGETSYIGMGCTGYTLTSSCPSEKREVAWRFLKYIVSKEGQELLGENGNGVPVLKSLLEDKNSAWRQWISPSLNHEAFYKFPERDLPAVSYLDNIPVAKQLTIYQTLKIKLLKEVYEAKGSERDDYYVSNLQATLERNLNS